jgi:hypothetical protein
MTCLTQRRTADSGLDLFAQGTGDNFKNVMDQMIQQQYTPRHRAQVELFFAGTDLVEPGLVPVEDWRPGPGTHVTGKSAVWGGVGRKR